MNDPLFTPLYLNNKNSLKNRLVMGSIHTGLEDIPFFGMNRLTHFYKKRAQGGVGLIVTGGISPNFKGRLHLFGKQLSFFWQVYSHKKMTKVVHDHGAKICLQILHAGRYAHHPFSVAPSALKAPINKFTPKEMTDGEIKKTIKDFVNTAKLAHRAGYDGVELMGSEGYLINEFLALETNQRSDEWGGNFENRMKFPCLIAKEIRAALPKDFILIYRISLLDLVYKGNTWQEIETLAQELEKIGVDIFDSGIGWHEARIPTIATKVPRHAFINLTQKLKKALNTPVMATNRINMPVDARAILNNDQADLISMARPWLADENWANKAVNNQENLINTCIACNQACLDHVFQGKIASCLVNPKACHETKYKESYNKKLKIAIVGAGPAGVSAAIEASMLGHTVTLFEKNSELGGQFNIAKDIPGKEEFKETIRYFKEMIEHYHINLRLNTDCKAANIKGAGFDHIIIASGVTPFIPKIPGIENEMVLSYPQAVHNIEKIGKRVAIIGAGGIGFDIATLLLSQEDISASDFFDEWGVDSTVKAPGGLVPRKKTPIKREVYLLQRKNTRFGKTLGRTTGWSHRLELKHKEVKMLAGVEYKEILPGKLVITLDNQEKVLDVDHIIICAGQRSVNKLYYDLKDEKNVHLIGGALLAAEVDAKRAIEEGVKLVHKISL